MRVNTFNLTIYLRGDRYVSFRGISRVAVKRYIKHYEDNDPNYRGRHIEERKAI